MPTPLSHVCACRVPLLVVLLGYLTIAFGVEVSHQRCSAAQGFCSQVIKGMVKGSKNLVAGAVEVPCLICEDIMHMVELPLDATHAYVFWRTWLVEVKKALGRAWTNTKTLQVASYTLTPKCLSHVIARSRDCPIPALDQSN